MQDRKKAKVAEKALPKGNKFSYSCMYKHQSQIRIIYLSITRKEEQKLQSRQVSWYNALTDLLWQRLVRLQLQQAQGSGLGSAWAQTQSQRLQSHRPQHLHLW